MASKLASRRFEALLKGRKSKRLRKNRHCKGCDKCIPSGKRRMVFPKMMSSGPSGLSGTRKKIIQRNLLKSCMGRFRRKERQAHSGPNNSRRNKQKWLVVVV